MLIALSVVMLAATLTYAEKNGYYETVLVKGFAYAEQNLTQVLKAKIPAHQCDGGLEYPSQYKCDGPFGGTYVPLALQIQVLELGEPATISMDSGLRHASVYRVADQSGQCPSPAKVIVSVAC